MKIRKTIRLIPTEEQNKQLWRSAGVSRWVYNWTIARQQQKYEQGEKFVSDNELRKELTQLKKQEDFQWLSEVSNNVAKQAVKDACDAYKRFFKGYTQFPKFKSKKKNKPSFYNDNVKLKVKHNLVLIEKVGWIKTSEQLPTDVKYMNPRIKFDGKYWYLSVVIETVFPKIELTDEIIGIDLGIKDLAICSNNKVFKNINKTKKVIKIEKKLKRMQRKVSKKYNMNKEGVRFVKTKNIIKVENQIKLLHRKLANIRKNYIHQTTTAIVKTKPCKVVMENLNVTWMMKNKHLSKAIAKQGFHEFKRQIEYKCEKYGIIFIQAPRLFPSSKTCSSCGVIKKDLKLSDRVYKCECGLEIDRDLNAAVNLANYGKLTA